jgi:hypothetical protein
MLNGKLNLNVCDIVEILLKVALNTINQINSKSNLILEFFCFTDQYFEYLDCDFFVLFGIGDRLV